MAVGMPRLAERGGGGAWLGGLGRFSFEQAARRVSEDGCDAGEGEGRQRGKMERPPSDRHPGNADSEGGRLGKSLGGLVEATPAFAGAATTYVSGAPMTGWRRGLTAT